MSYRILSAVIHDEARKIQGDREIDRKRKRETEKEREIERKGERNRNRCRKDKK